MHVATNPDTLQLDSHEHLLIIPGFLRMVFVPVSLVIVVKTEIPKTFLASVSLSMLEFGMRSFDVFL